jgi:outer membrane protein OmpA-like peptidoglycan-associated protein
MKLFNSISVLLGLVCLLNLSARAQQPYYEWRVGGGVGVMGYHGDVSYRLNTKQASFLAYTVFLEKKLSPSFGLELNGALGKITANDRTKNWKGDLVTANPDFGRALNFQTDIRSAGLLLNYYFDNGRILSEYSRFAPFLFIGASLTDFTVYGDLYSASGGRYYYWSDQTVRSQPEGTGAQTPVIEQDGTFETKLSELRTEGVDYPTTVLSIPAGVGVKMKLSDQLSLRFQVGATYAFTDYLDDVSGNFPAAGFDNELQAYAANPSGTIRQPRGEAKANNDWCFSSFLTLSYHFGYKKKDFKAPLVYTGYRQAGPLARNEANAPSNTMLPNNTVQGNRPVEQQLAPTSPRQNEVSRGVTRDVQTTVAPIPQETYRQATDPNTSQPANIPYSSQSLQDLDKVRADSIRNQIRQQELTRQPGLAPRSTNQTNQYGTRQAYSDPAYNRPPDNRTYRPYNQYDPVYNQQPTQSYVPIPVPVPSGSSGYADRPDTVYLRSVSSANVTTMQNDLDRLRADLTTLRAGNDPATNRKLDSLLTLVGALDRQATENLRAKYGADRIEARTDTMAQLAANSDTTVISALRNQVEDLNRSLERLREESLAAPREPVSRSGALSSYGTLVVYYDTNKWALSAADQQRLEGLAAKMKDDPSVKLHVKGYTDQTGNPEYNLMLSRKRAEGVVQYLKTTHGIEPGRILVNYYGQTGEAKLKGNNNPYQRKVEMELFAD